MCDVIFKVVKDISIHAAREGGDSLCLIRFFLLQIISIHAAREGGDEATLPSNGDILAFQSTPPVKAATKKFLVQQGEFSISIHAAREGGDDEVSFKSPERLDFNPRRP